VQRGCIFPRVMFSPPFVLLPTFSRNQSSHRILLARNAKTVEGSILPSLYTNPLRV
jgi:hypothetical protein